ncbi:MxaA protein [Methylophaga frappieri]|uniref:MxaA protein n=1 Tax=Methylophaga frappieri (strain ATCC BAA-2434 / DSM 25690 / JAM7) TaxID=754477 RepID=I1YK12_METFJ|nr:hypothetical protein [Methylophaga frappieri]AFJ03255.1 MxaA protein [Methylophaga frappieri]
MQWRWIKALLCVAMLSLTLPALGEVPTGIVKQSLGRDFGVLAGDLIRHEYILQVPADYDIAEASLPATGDLSYWLTLQDVQVELLDSNSARALFQVVLIYQTFYAPLDVRELTIPAQTIRAHHSNGEEIILSLPDWNFMMSPLKEIVPRGVGATDSGSAFMKPSLPPVLQPLADKQNRVIALAIIATLLGLAWVVLNGWLWQRKQSPFQQAAKKINKLDKNQQDEKRHLKAFEAIHHAFNAVAGQVVFTYHLPFFFENHPEFITYQNEITTFFEQSDALMFGQANDQQPTLKELQQLARRLSRAEPLVVHA